MSQILLAILFPCQALLQGVVKLRNEKLFVGVDEYDAPANSALFSSEPGLYERVADLFKSQFFSIIKNAVSEHIIIKYWLTGVLPAFRDGISPLTALNIISFQPQCHRLCGLTDAEVQSITQVYLGPGCTSDDITKAMDILPK